MQQRFSILLILALAVASFPASAVNAQDWKPLKTPVSESILGIQFVHPDTGYFCTADGRVVRTTDGCKLYEVFKVKPGVSFEDVCALSGDTAYVCGRNGTFLRTFNGGLKWEDWALRDTAVTLTAVQMFSPTEGLLTGIKSDTGSRYLGAGYRTTDGGEHWDTLPSMGMVLGDIFYRPGSPVVVQAWGRTNFSKDMGKTWDFRNNPTDVLARTSAFFGRFGLLAGNVGALAYTEDGGNTWTKVSQKQGVNLTSIVIIDARTAYVAGTSGTMLKTIDGGKTWTEETLPGPVDIFDMCLIGKRLYAVGSFGAIMRKTVR